MDKLKFIQIAASGKSTVYGLTSDGEVFFKFLGRDGWMKLDTEEIDRRPKIVERPIEKESIFGSYMDYFI